MCSDLLSRYSSSYSSLASASAADGSSGKPAESVKLRCLVSSCLEGVAHATTLFSTRYSQHLSRFLKTLGTYVYGKNMSIRKGGDMMWNSQLNSSNTWFGYNRHTAATSDFLFDQLIQLHEFLQVRLGTPEVNMSVKNCCSWSFLQTTCPFCSRPTVSKHWKQEITYLFNWFI